MIMKFDTTTVRVLPHYNKDSIPAHSYSLTLEANRTLTNINKI